MVYESPRNGFVEHCVGSMVMSKLLHFLEVKDKWALTTTHFLQYIVYRHLVVHVLRVGILKNT